MTTPPPPNVTNADILAEIKLLRSEVADIEFLMNPMSNSEFAAIPVLGSGNDAEHYLGTTTNCSTYTWVRYKNEAFLVGAVHRALLYGTKEKDKLFLSLPKSITMLGVRCVWLLQPYGPEFTNPLPTKYDIIYIAVHTVPQTKLPALEKSTPSKKTMQYDSRLVGRSPVSVVSSKDGMVNVDTDKDSIGMMSFFLDRGEPGDSGTLLFCKRDGKLVPRGIFVGIEPTRPRFEKRGLAATLPNPEALECLPVLANSQLKSLQLVDWDSNGWQEGTLAVEKKSLNAVDLVYNNRVVAHGVVVKSKQMIRYIGKMDHAKMWGKI